MEKSKIIKLAFFLFSLFLSFLTFSRFNSSFVSVELFDIFLTAVFVVVFVGFFVLTLFLFDGYFPFLTFLAFLAIFLLKVGFSVQMFFVALVALLLFLFAYIRMEHNLKNALKIRFHSAILYGASTIVTISALLMASASYFFPFDISEFKVSEKMFKPILPVAEKIIKLQAPFYESGMNVDEFLLKSASLQTGISESVLKKNFSAELKKQRQELSKNLGLELSGKDTLLSLMVKKSNFYIEKYISSNERIIPFVFALFVFLTIKSFGFFLNRFGVFLAWIAFEALKLLKVIRIEKGQTEKEIVKI